ncbi:hypothetical protein ALP74_101787 [Pseudomonas coronafaciens pv. garcae]|uniref:Uncharacterized protein n=1 Tax=Pseudomonas coronafaciens pv. garcae TaxID=251653 RepID=A0AB37QJ63_9PSED|nr:hypothetical protein ALP74_101787 [Pseudomonas coronafaciens pv. garcae]
MRPTTLKAIRAIRNGAAATRPHTQDSRKVAATPKTRPPISKPTIGMMGMFQNIAGRLIAL